MMINDVVTGIVSDKQMKRLITYLDNVSEVLAPDVVVGLDEDLAQPALSYRGCTCIELVKSMESIPVL